MQNLKIRDIKIQMPPQAEEILNKLHKAGYKAYIVGGCVRDSLLSIKPKDWDICTSATPEQVEAVFSNERIVETGLQHGTVTIMKQGEPFEVTTFRIDGEYTDSRHPESVSFTDSIEKDLSRRDFTINAMAYNHEEGLIDPFGGEIDLTINLLRCVGEPETRFKEDALRILRALRFSCGYGLDIHFTTKLAMLKQSASLTDISAERIQSELCKVLTADTANVFKTLKNNADIFSVILPEFSDMFGFEQNNPWHCYNVWMHTLHAIKNCGSPDLITRLAALFHDIGKPHCRQTGEDGIDHFKGHGKVSAEITNTIMRRLKFDNDTREKVVELVEMHDNIIEPSKPTVKRLLNKIGIEQLRRLVNLRIADVKAQNPVMENGRIKKAELILALAEEVIKEQGCFSLKDLAVNGRDLIQAGYTPGESLGATLQYLLNEVVDDNLPNQKDVLLTEAKRLLDIPHEHETELSVGSKVYYIDYEETGVAYTVTGKEQITEHPVFPEGILYTIHVDNLPMLTGYYPLHESNIDKDGGHFFSTPEKASEAYTKFKEYAKQKEAEM